MLTSAAHVQWEEEKAVRLPKPSKHSRARRIFFIKWQPNLSLSDSEFQTEIPTIQNLPKGPRPRGEDLQASVFSVSSSVRRSARGEVWLIPIVEISVLSL